MTFFLQLCVIRNATMFFLLSATRRDTHKLLIESYSKCKVRISRKPELEKLLSTRRTAKIAARRKTITVDYVAPSTSNCSSTSLFKKISDKPFWQRRRSIAANKLQTVASNKTDEVAGPSGVQRPGNKNDDSAKVIGEASVNADGDDIPQLSDAIQSENESIELTTTPTASSDVRENVSSNQSDGNVSALVSEGSDKQQPGDAEDDHGNMIDEDEGVELQPIVDNQSESSEPATTSNAVLKIVATNKANESIPIGVSSGIQKSTGCHNETENSNMDFNIDADLEGVNANESGNSPIEPTASHGGSLENSTFSDDDKENVASSEENLLLLLPFLPPVIVSTDAVAKQCSSILDIDVPIAHELILPIAPKSPIQVNAKVEEDLIQIDCEIPLQILDFSIPQMIDLPAPIAPLQENGNRKRSVPALIPICDMKPKTYGPAKKKSKTSEMILGVLKTFDQSKETVPAEVVNVTVDFESDDSIGRLACSDASEPSSESGNE